MADESEARTIADIATAATSVERHDPGEIFSVVIPEGYQHSVVDIDEYLDGPRRKTGAVRLHDAASLRAYIRAHREHGRTALYASVDSVTITAVLNGHEEHPKPLPGLTPEAVAEPQAGWGDHKAVLALRHTENWQHWTGQDRKWLPQARFAEHIEEGLIDIVEPPAADMLEMAQTFQATTKVAFKSSSLLHNGQRQLKYEETIESKAGQQGNLTVPQFFTLNLAVFEGQTEVFPVGARLQTRIEGHALSVRYLLDRPHDVKRAAFDTAVADVEGVGLLAYRGELP